MPPERCNTIYYCPVCGGDVEVIDTRADLRYGIKRRRSCLRCQNRQTTYEVHNIGPEGLRVLSSMRSLDPEVQKKLWRSIKANTDALLEIAEYAERSGA